MREIDRSVRDFEPKLALVSGERGTEIYERLARDLPHYLNPRAKVFFEIGAAQGAAVQEIFSASPWRSQRVLKDWAGLDRFFFLEVE